MMNQKQIERTYYLTVFLFWLTTGLPIAFVVLFMQARGMDLSQVGWLMGLYSLTVVLLEVPTGGLADAIGRKPVSLLAYSVGMVGMAIFIFAFSFPVFLMAWVLLGLGRALASGALDAWFIDALQALDPDIDIQPPLAKAGTYALLALGGGSLLGSAIPGLFSFLPEDGTALLSPLVIPVFLSLATNVALLFVVARWVKEERTAEQNVGLWSGIAQVPQIVRDASQGVRQSPALLLLMGSTLALGLSLSSIESFWQPHFAGLMDKDSPTFYFGIIMAGNFLVGVVGNIAATPLSRLFNQRYALVSAVFQGLQGLLLILAALQFTALWGVLLLWFVYFNGGLLNSPRGALTNQFIPAERRSSMLSILSLVGYLGSFAGSAGLGYLAESSGTKWAWIVAGAVLVVSLLLYIPIDRQRPAAETADTIKVEIIHEPEAQILETT